MRIATFVVSAALALGLATGLIAPGQGAQAAECAEMFKKVEVLESRG